MNLWVSLLSTSFWSIIQVTIWLTRLVPPVYTYTSQMVYSFIMLLILILCIERFLFSKFHPVLQGLDILRPEVALLLHFTMLIEFKFTLWMEYTYTLLISVKWKLTCLISENVFFSFLVFTSNYKKSFFTLFYIFNYMGNSESNKV